MTVDSGVGCANADPRVLLADSSMPVPLFDVVFLDVLETRGLVFTCFGGLGLLSRGTNFCWCALIGAVSILHVLELFLAHQF